MLCEVKDVAAWFGDTAGNGWNETGLVGTGYGKSKCLLVHGVESIPKRRFLQYNKKKTSRKEEENGWSLRCNIYNKYHELEYSKKAWKNQGFYRIYYGLM